jgi:predicted metal-dependent enzyme (double-stranded beta helix superfamily)
MDATKNTNDRGASVMSAATVTPFAGHPAANLARAKRKGMTYGLQPGSGTLITELSKTMHAAMKNCSPHGLSAAAKASLRGYLCEPDLLTTAQKQSDADSYRRHLLYAAEDRSFSILAIVWNPGQCTPVHGHTAWGAAGVHSGNPYCESFINYESAPQVLSLRSEMKLRLHPGDIATVEPGIDAAHRIGNDGISRCITVHIYGRDLLASPGSINIILNN